MVLGVVVRGCCKELGWWRGLKLRNRRNSLVIRDFLVSLFEPNTTCAVSYYLEFIFSGFFKIFFYLLSSQTRM